MEDKKFMSSFLIFTPSKNYFKLILNIFEIFIKYVFKQRVKISSYLETGVIFEELLLCIIKMSTA